MNAVAIAGQHAFCDPGSASSVAAVAGAFNPVLVAMRKLGLEGVAANVGERSGAWIKHRTNREQEFVSGGYVPGARF